MNNQWQSILIKITVWLIVEIFMNLLGVDTLADYSEFIFEGKTPVIKGYVSEIAIVI